MTHVAQPNKVSFMSDPALIANEFDTPALAILQKEVVQLFIRDPTDPTVHLVAFTTYAATAGHELNESFPFTSSAHGTVWIIGLLPVSFPKPQSYEPFLGCSLGCQTRGSGNRLPLAQSSCSPCWCVGARASPAGSKRQDGSVPECLGDLCFLRVLGSNWGRALLTTSGSSQQQASS
ncbi:UNVERIFIED_CONTAM: hypothetical protein K2H54_004638 [Gekko kuhli]